MILTSAARSVGEVRITEAERSDRVFPGRKGYLAEVAACTANTSGYSGRWEVCGTFVYSAEG